MFHLLLGIAVLTFPVCTVVTVTMLRDRSRSGLAVSIMRENVANGQKMVNARRTRAICRKCVGRLANCVLQCPNVIAVAMEI